MSEMNEGNEVVQQPNEGAETSPAPATPAEGEQPTPAEPAAPAPAEGEEPAE